MERTEVEHIAEAVVSLAIAKYHGENVSRLTSIEERIKGIDGNGTGRDGAIQRLEQKLDDMGDGVKTLLTKESETRGALGVRQKYTGWALGVLAAVFSTGGIILGEWVKHRMGW